LTSSFFGVILKDVVKFFRPKFSFGFTIVELLVVIAIIGVVATMVVISLNPPEKLAYTRDSGRKSTVAQLGNVLKEYSMFNGSYPIPENQDWLQYLLSEGELKILPVDVTINEDFDCASAGTTMENELGEEITITWSKKNGYCYGTDENGTIAIIYTPLESETEKTNCANKTAYYVWTSTGKEGTYCDPFGTIDTIAPLTPTPSSTSDSPTITPINAPTATPTIKPTITLTPTQAPTATPVPLHHPTGAINGPGIITIGQTGTFNATLNDVDGNLSMIYLEIEGPPKGTQNWTVLTSPACNGGTCSASYTWTPLQAGEYTIIVRGKDNTNLGCSGNPYITYPNGIYTSCGSSGSIVVTAAAPAYSLTVNKTGTGTVTSIPAGINCETACTANFSKDYSITLTANPASGYRFNSWTGCTSSSGNSCTVLMSAAKTVTANFIVNAPVAKIFKITGQGSQYHCLVGAPACGCGSAYGSGTLNNLGDNYYSTIILTNYGFTCYQPNGSVQDSSFKFEPLTDLTATITKINLTAKGAGYSAVLNVFFRSTLGVNYYGNNATRLSYSQPGTTSWEWTVNPATNQPWRVEDFNTGEFGVYGNTGSLGMSINYLVLTLYYIIP